MRPKRQGTLQEINQICILLTGLRGVLPLDHGVPPTPAEGRSVASRGPELASDSWLVFPSLKRVPQSGKNKGCQGSSPEAFQGSPFLLRSLKSEGITNARKLVRASLAKRHPRRRTSASSTPSWAARREASGGEMRQGSGGFGFDGVWLKARGNRHMCHIHNK